MMSHGSVDPIRVAVFSISQIDLKKSRAPELAFVRVAAGLFGAIDHLRNLRGRNRKRGGAAAQAHAQRRKFPAGRSDFVAIADGAEFVRLRQRQIDRRLMMPEMEGGPQLQPGRLSRRR